MARDSEILVGGQAVLEGVMMKTPRAWAVTVRTPDGGLVTRSGDVVPWSERWPVLRLPVLRGGAVLGQMLALGMRALFFSSDVMAAEERKVTGKSAAGASTLLALSSLMVLGAVADGPDGDEDEDADGSKVAVRPAQPAATPSRGGDARVATSVNGAGASGDARVATSASGAGASGDARVATSVSGAGAGAGDGAATSASEAGANGLSSGELAIAIGGAALMFLVVFKALPLGIAWLAGAAFPVLKAPLAESLISGLALAGVFVGYLLLMSRMKDIRRVFQYHGAEHQVVHLHEKGQEPTVANAALHSTIHPRCGTSFLFFVVLTSIVVWSLFPMDVGFFGKLGLRLALFPLVLGLAYELIRLSARHRDNAFFRVLMAPGLWSQRITTKPPDDSMREVSLHSLAVAGARGSAPAA